jgi:SnoaL-like domain
MEDNDLREIEPIKKLKARYFRHMDQQRWDEWKKCFTEDVTAVYDGPPRLNKRDDPAQVACEGRTRLVDAVSGLFVESKSVHQGFMPEIELTSPTTATGIWAMFDYIRTPRGSFKGWGHYYEEYVKQEGEWKIKKIRLTRLHVEEIWEGL